jgi:hypothetical protein
MFSQQGSDECILVGSLVGVEICLFYGLFYEAVNISDYIALKGMLIGEYLIGRKQSGLINVLF